MTSKEPNPERSDAGPRKRDRKVPLRVALIVPFLVLIVAAVGTTTLLSIRHGQRAVDDVVGQLRDEITKRIDQYLITYLDTAHLINEFNTGALALGHLDERDPKGMARHFWYQLQPFEYVSFVFYGTKHGGAAGAGRIKDGTSVVDTTDVDPELGLISGTRYEYAADERGNRTNLLKSNPGFDARKRPWFGAAVEAGTSVWSDVYLFFAEKSLAIAYSTPVYDETGELRGVLGIDLSLAKVGAYLRGLGIGQTGETLIVERSGLVVASSGSAEPFVVHDDGKVERLDASESQNPLIAATARAIGQRFGDLASIQDVQSLMIDVTGERQFVTVAPIRHALGLDWLIVVILPESDFMAQIEANRRDTIILCVVALLIAIGLGILTSRWIARPILRLNAASRAIASGHWDQNVRVGSVSELGELADSFNQMATGLKHSFEEVEGQVAQRTAELKDAKDAADQANKAKSTFLANISHEIRTPLAAILGYVELLWDRGKSAQQADLYLRSIRDNGRHLNQLLSDLLDISRIEASRLELDIKPCQLDDLLVYIGSLFRPRATDRGLGFEIRTNKWLPWRFSTDVTRVRQILANLVGNAIKFTEQGGVTLTVECDYPRKSEEVDGPDRTLLTFVVEDSGIGISPELQKVLFQRFTQMHANPHRDAGVGLGLSITKQLVDLFGGTISVESEQGKGTRIAFSVPVTGCAEWSDRGFGYRPPLSQAILSELPALTGRILIAEDSQPLQLLCKEMLESWGLHCQTVETGRQAIGAATSEDYDLVLMDWQMPDVDGLQATRELRATGLETPIVALTAAAMSGDREACLAAGCNDYLVKPIDFRQLHDLLSSLLPAAERAASKSSVRTDGTVAAVDDGDRAGPLAKLSQEYVRNLPATVDELRQAHDSSDWPSINAIVHKLVGTSGTYRLTAIFEIAEALESAGQRQDHGQVRTLLVRLSDSVGRAIEELG